MLGVVIRDPIYMPRNGNVRVEIRNNGKLIEVKEGEKDALIKWAFNVRKQSY